MHSTQNTQFIFGQFVECFENKMYVVKSLPGDNKSTMLEIYRLNEELFEFIREQEIKMDVDAKSVSFNNEGTLIVNSDSTLYLLGTAPVPFNPRIQNSGNLQKSSLRGTDLGPEADRNRVQDQGGADEDAHGGSAHGAHVHPLHQAGGPVLLVQ